MRISAKKASDCLVTVFFLGTLTGEGSVINAEVTAFGLPFLAMIFHAVGLKAMNPRERKRDGLEVSTRRDMFVMVKVSRANPVDIFFDASSKRVSCFFLL
jgi:hypothetical protein